MLLLFLHTVLHDVVVVVLLGTGRRIIIMCQVPVWTVTWRRYPEEETKNRLQNMQVCRLLDLQIFSLVCLVNYYVFCFTNRRLKLNMYLRSNKNHNTSPYSVK